MLAQLIFRQQSQRERQASCILVVIGIIIIAVFAIQITDYRIKPPTAPLLPASSSLVQFSSVDEAQSQSRTKILLPAQLLDATVHTVGIYHQKTGNLPAESVVTILVKNDWRFAEIIQRPGRSLAQELSEDPGRSQEPIQLGSLAGVMQDISRGYEHCFEPPADGTPGFCLLTHKIAFELNGQLVTLAGSTPYITQGELIALARSIIEKEKPPIIIEDSSVSIDETATK